jgi:hypothetical protein
MYSLNAKGNEPFEKAKRQRRYEYVRDKTAELFKAGNKVYSPIVHCFDMANHNDLPQSYEFWQETDRHMIDISEGIFVLKMETHDGLTWEDSTGMKDEVTYAILIGKPIIFLDASDFKDLTTEEFENESSS